MKKAMSVLSFIFLLSAHAEEPATTVPAATKREQPHTRVTYPSAFNVEMLGRGMLWNITFDQVLNDDMAAGFGFGAVSTQTASGADGNQTATMVPAYFHYYFSRTQGSVYATGGLNLILNASKVRDLESSTGGLEFRRDSIIPTFGVGYENRGDNGFLFRIAAYGLLGDDLTPWMGFTFGYAF